MEKLAQTKDFCPNAACPDYGKLQQDQSKANLKRSAKHHAAYNATSAKLAEKPLLRPKGPFSTANMLNRMKFWKY